MDRKAIDEIAQELGPTLNDKQRSLIEAWLSGRSTKEYDSYARQVM